MKKLSTVLFLLFAALTTFAQKDGKKVESPRAAAHDKNVSVDYGQPSKRGREIFGGLVPYGEVWRTGANEATTITFKKDGMFGGEKVEAGTYTLFTIPGKENWTIILNSQMKQWGSFKYEQYKDKDVMKATVIAATCKETEKLTITPKDDALEIMWDKTMVSVPMKF